MRPLRAVTTAVGIATLSLAGCGPSENDPGPGGVSVGEARALDEAAEMIEARRLAPGALDAQGEATQEPAPEAAPQGDEPAR